MPKLIRAFDHDSRGATLLTNSTVYRQRSLLFTAGRQILLQDLSSGDVKVLGDGYDCPAGIVASPDGKTAFVADLDLAQKHFTLFEFALHGADRAKARAVLRAAGQPMQLAAQGGTLLFADRFAGELVALDLASHKTHVALGGLASPVGVVLTPNSKRAFVSESRAGRIVSTVIGSGTAQVGRVGLASPQYLTLSDNSQRIVIAEQGSRGLVQAWNVAQDRVDTLLTSTEGNRPLAAWELGHELIVIDYRKILWYDLRGILTLPVSLSIENAKPFIGSYQRVRVHFGTTGLTFNALDFKVPEGEPAGQISLARDDLSAADEFMLLVGYQPGVHKLEAIDKATSSVVASLEFEITDRWWDADRSPAHWSVGELSSFTTGYTWGGGPATPQNVDVIPQSGTRNICILTVDVSDARYPTGSTFDTIKTRWSNGAVGTTPDPDGKVRSARQYYEEVSFGGFTLALAGAQVLSINLGSNWSDNFSTMPSPWPANSFAPTNNTAFAQSCISAAAALTDGSGNPLVDFQQIQTLIMVIRSAGPAATDNFFWPQAWGGSFTVPGGSANVAVLGMPDDWDITRDSRTIYETLSHEIGHNLGYPDLYTNANPLFTSSVIARDISDFDLMSNEGELPHMSVAQKMETGWIRPEWVMPLDFSRSTIPLDTTVTLHASELGSPPSGRFSATEIRLADGWNYYFEYRSGQSPQIGDQLLGTDPATDTANGVVLGTDVVTLGFTFPIARPQVMRLQKDAEGENSFFAAGQDYKETDTSSMAISDFRMSVISTATDNARIRIQYGTNGRPDLYIRPWPGGDDWQSPDIEVQNDRALADPANWRNVPWVGHANTVIARFRNRGPVTATNVKVDFFVKDFTVGGAPEAPLGSDTHDVPPESGTPFVEFKTDWIPPDDGHKCIIARTPLYIDASVSPSIVEITDTNNLAQSNYSRYIAASASPAKRGITHVTLSNPFDKRAEIYVVPQIRGPFFRFYRLYLEHSSLKLDPGESRKVQVMMESMYGDPKLAAILERQGQKFFIDTRMSLAGYGIPPDTPAHPILLGGVQINVGSGRATKFEQFGWEKDGGIVRGRVVIVANGAPASGFVLLTFHGQPERVGSTLKVNLDGSGYFFARGANELIKQFRAKRISAHYPGKAGLSPCDAPNELVP